MNSIPSKPVYVAPYFNGPFQIGLIVLFNAFLLYMGVKHLHWFYFLLLIIFCLAPFVEKVSIYEDKIVRRRTIILYSWTKTVLFNDVYLFEHQTGGRDSDRYILRHKEGKKTNKIGFYIIKKEGMNKLLELCKSKGIKTEGNFKWILQILE